MHKKKIKVNPVDQVLQVLIYLIIIALCLIISGSDFVTSLAYAFLLTTFVTVVFTLTINI